MTKAVSSKADFVSLRTVEPSADLSKSAESEEMSVTAKASLKATFASMRSNAGRLHDSQNQRITFEARKVSMRIRQSRQSDGRARHPIVSTAAFTLILA